jgi:hypothetical protein
MSKNFRLNASIQFGYTSVQDEGIAPLFLTGENLYKAKTAVVLTPQENLAVHAQDISTDTYLIVANQDTVSTVNYMIVSTS